MLLFCIAPAIAQGKKRPVTKEKARVTTPAAKPMTAQMKRFLTIAAQANVSFSSPAGFKEVPAPDDEDFSFDYAMALPGKDFEIWFQVKSQKENWAAYQRTYGNRATRQANPDSLYIGMGTATAAAFTGDRNSFTRTIPQRYLAPYNADAGRSYLLNLLDLPATKHYKYGLLVTLQKDHVGTILAVCFTNEKGPEFFKNVNRASTCIKFKP